jgi:hypothetical protein|nr:MAG TPA: hypothetical protein [Caudoviricetes sp.]
MAEYIEREALLHDIEQSVVYTVREKITSAEMRGAHKVIERIKCAPAVEPIYIHEPTKSEFKCMAVQMGYAPVVRCKDCKYSTLPSKQTQIYGKPGTLTCHNRKSPCNRRNVASDDYCSHGEKNSEVNT